MAKVNFVSHDEVYDYRVEKVPHGQSVSNAQEPFIAEGWKVVGEQAEKGLTLLILQRSKNGAAKPAPFIEMTLPAGDVPVMDTASVSTPCPNCGSIAVTHEPQKKAGVHNLTCQECNHAWEVVA
jgi:predicted RNA-binding Zn-ribbon protein involved in translation (DUF1610 family)